MVGRLEAGDFIGVGIHDLGLETLTCLEPRKNVLAVDSFSCSAAFFAFKVVVGLLHPYDGVVARLAKPWSFTVPQFCSTAEFREP